jgi:2-polyprenyl-6-methoxyphenol hydroxylase-like FAD-dependent oxidoreductase
MSARYDAVVVGGRVAGASTALLLARAGARVALLKRSPRGSDTVSTHALMRGGVLQLSRWGLLPDLLRAGTPPIRRTLFHYLGDPPVQVSIRRSPGVDALYAPRRHVLDTLLVDAAAAAGVHVVHGVTATALLHHERRVCGVVARGRSGAEQRWWGDVVVGADGVRSTVARSAAAVVERRAAVSGSVLYRYFDDVPVAGYEWAYGDRAAAGMIPTNGGLTCVFVATSPERLRHVRRLGAEAALTALVDTAAPALAARVHGGAPVGRVHGWSGSRGFLRRAGGPGWALVGDAGYFKDPITTHGMTDALRDAELLTDALLAVWSGAVAEPVALRRYQAQRDRLSHGLFTATDRIAAYDWDQPSVQALLREVSASMSDETELLQALPTRRQSAEAGSGPADMLVHGR